MNPAEFSEPTDFESISARIVAGVAASAMAAGSAVVALINPSASNMFPVCPLLTLTGLACPGCGLTRGFHALFHGDLIAALDFNALILIWAVILGYVFVSLAVLAIRGRGLPMWPTSPRFLWWFLVILLVFGVARNIPVWPLTILYP